MAPTSTRDSAPSKLSTKDRHKLRKPVVEKMRRDRINSCIEQLKVLLENEFHKQDPNAKLEKADVLEMTVVFLKRQLQLHGRGYSHCWKETLHFLSQNPPLGLQPFQAASRAARDPGPTAALSSEDQVQAAGKQQCSPSRAVWRPW